MIQYEPIDVAVALSLYAHNVEPSERAQRLFDQMNGECSALIDLVEIMVTSSATIATTLPPPVAAAYVWQAMQAYGAEAIHRNRRNGTRNMEFCE